MKKGFTLVELIMTMTILAIVMVTIGGLANFTTSRLKSSQLKMTNDALRASLSQIGQKMYNANDRIKIGADTDYTYGFKKSGDLLIIVSSDTGVPTCTYFGLNIDRLSMNQNNCGTYMTSADLTNSLTPSKIKITSFAVTSSNEMTGPATTEIPKVEISVEGYDITDPKEVRAKFETTFTMDGDNVNYLKNL